MRRVVVTGIGMVTPLGIRTDRVWASLLAGQSGITCLQDAWAADLTSRIAGVVPSGTYEENGFDPAQWVQARDLRRMARFIHLGIAASTIAFEDSGIEIATEEQAYRAGINIGSGIGGLDLVVEGANILEQQGLRRLTPFYIPSALINLVSGNVSIKYNLKGPNCAVVTACSTGSHAIGDSARIIALGDADVMVAGGSEAPLCLAGVGGFCAARALSTGYNSDPGAASRPWDKDRDGFVISEGAGVVILEEYERAKARGAKIYAEVVGYGMSGDAYHITAPAMDGNGGLRAMQAALRSAGRTVDAVDYINAHGTSTPLGDDIELNGATQLLGAHRRNVAMSSTKSMLGHMLGAAGAVEAISTILTIFHGQIPPTINLHTPSVVSEIDRVPHQAQERDVKLALSNSFGFGGTNVSLAFAQI